MDSFSSRSKFLITDDDESEQSFEYYRLDKLDELGISKINELPFTHRILLENLLRNEDGISVTESSIRSLAEWQPNLQKPQEIAFTPARVLLQDFTGVPAVLDLASMRGALRDLGGDPDLINPQQPVDLVIDHSVQVDHYAQGDAFQKNVSLEYNRNLERYLFLRWGQQAFQNFQVTPPGTGIVHQVNLEHLAQCVFNNDGLTYPDTLIGTDSHTTMINGLGILGWGVGGIEAEAAMLGQPVPMLVPEVVGVRITGKLPEGSTGTDLVLTITENLRSLGVVGKFVEFFGTGLSNLPLATRATISNMAPEYGATAGFFPIDQETLKYLELTGREKSLVNRVETYCKLQNLFRNDATPDPKYSQTLEINLSSIEPSIAGPKRPQDRISLSNAKAAWNMNLQESKKPSDEAVLVERGDESFELSDGSVVIAAITSCTNTSNPEVMIGAGLLAKKAIQAGLQRKPWVKTSLAPGSKIVTRYLDAAGLTPYLNELGFNLVGYGCTTCIGNSGPIDTDIAKTVSENGTLVAAVLSGNRNFEGRINPVVQANYLASPPLVVTYALKGHMDFDPFTDALGENSAGQNVYMRDIWPTQQEITDTIGKAISSKMFQEEYAHAFTGDNLWRELETPSGGLYEFSEDSTYVRNPPYFDNFSLDPQKITDIVNARVLVKVGDSVTTDHISPAGIISPKSPAADYLLEKGVEQQNFNSYGARRGNHEVMMRGTFANIRLRNQLVPGTEGGYTRHFPSNQDLTIFDASARYIQENIPLVILAGKEYGTGSSRDWAAKGPMLLGVRVVIAESYERIHRSNLIGMGILPLQYKDADTAQTLDINGDETFSFSGLSEEELRPGSDIKITMSTTEGLIKTFTTKARIDTPVELEYFQNGGILQFVLRKLAKNSTP
jgi:aconitate hydratase